LCDEGTTRADKEEIEDEDEELLLLLLLLDTEDWD